MQLLFRGPSKYNNEMLENPRWETQMQIELPTSYYYNLKAHIAK